MKTNVDEASALTTEEQTTKLTVLVVDDEIEIRELLCELLESEGYQCEQACDGLDALNKYRQRIKERRPFDLLLVDQKMPIMNGESLIRIIRNEDDRLPIIVLTGHGDIDQAYHFLKHYHIADFLTKPLDCTIKLLFSIKNSLLMSEQKLGLKVQNDELCSQVKQKDERLTLAKMNEQYLEKLAFTDELTGLNNRSVLMLGLERELAVVKRDKKNFAVLFIDLDKFKPINDNYGHSIGDRVLVEVANRLKKTIRACDLLTRIGGDEFVVILTNIQHHSNCQLIVDKINDAIRETMTIQSHLFNISASIGVTFVSDSGLTPSMLLEQADKSMYDHKKNTLQSTWSLF